MSSDTHVTLRPLNGLHVAGDKEIVSVRGSNTERDVKFLPVE